MVAVVTLDAPAVQMEIRVFDPRGSQRPQLVGPLAECHAAVVLFRVLCIVVLAPELDVGRDLHVDDG